LWPLNISAGVFTNALKKKENQPALIAVGA
jgi:hypothetical protein